MSEVLTLDVVMDGLVGIVRDIAGVDVEPGPERGELSFTDDLDIDSLSMVEVVVAAEDEFMVTVPDAQIPKLVTLGDAAAYIHGEIVRTAK
ncbi:acyl carrier protein (plasmid) [Kitasatospora sp. NBC_00070]|uniref:acyl carrier protein n=1 Tax=Kitasatospora sp. NBC_00070 TaxID=2975962 RepID=UPI002F906D56